MKAATQCDLFIRIARLVENSQLLLAVVYSIDSRQQKNCAYSLMASVVGCINKLKSKQIYQPHAHVIYRYRILGVLVVVLLLKFNLKYLKHVCMCSIFVEGSSFVDIPRVCPLYCVVVCLICCRCCFFFSP